MKNIMNTDHPMWFDFVSCMKSPAECGHFEEPYPIRHGDTRHTRILLESYPDTDVTESFDYFKFWDADCDCSIEENVCQFLGPNYKEMERMRSPSQWNWAYLKDMFRKRRLKKP